MYVIILTKGVLKMSEQSARLLKVILDSKLSYAELEKRTGIAKSSIQRYATGNTKKIPVDAVKLIADATNSSASWIMGWEDETDYDKYSLKSIKTKKFPMLGKIACGQPIVANQEYETYIEASADINADFCLTAKGDSMINARIFDGDVVFIKKQPTVNNGEVAAVRIGDEVTLKRIYVYDNRVELRAENPLYQPMNYEGYQLDEIEILGKAVMFQSCVR